MATNPALILQFAIHLKQRILKVLLQGQRLVPYQRGPAALVSWPNRKMLWGLKARYISHHDSGTNIRMGRAFSPCFIERSDMIWSDILSMAFDHRWYVTGRWPWNKKLTGYMCRQNIFTCRDLCKIDKPGSNSNCSTKTRFGCKLLRDPSLLLCS